MTEQPKPDERCGVPIRVADLTTCCMRPIGHDGECRPLRSELRRRSDRHYEAIDEIDNYVTRRDRQHALWPHEGPKEGE